MAVEDFLKYLDELPRDAKGCRLSLEYCNGSLDHAEPACPWREIKPRPIDDHEIDYTDYVKRDGVFYLGRMLRSLAGRSPREVDSLIIASILVKKGLVDTSHCNQEGSILSATSVKYEKRKKPSLERENCGNGA